MNTTHIEPLTCREHEFSLPAGTHYLNCARMSPLSKRVAAAGLEGIRRQSSPDTITTESFFEETAHLRELFARLIGAGDPQRVAVIPSVSYGIATVARNVHPRSTQNLVVLAEQFPSNIYSWRRLSQETGAAIRSVAIDDATEIPGEALNAALLAAIDGETALVAVPFHHWSSGTRVDLTAVSQRARETGALFVVDGTQSVGAVPFDLEAVRPDALVCAGYKTLHGPYSIGLAWYGSRFDDGVPLEENWISRAGSEDFAGLVAYCDEYQPGAVRYDVGERSNFTLVPMMCAALEQILEWTPLEIHAYCARLMQDAFDSIQEIGFSVEHSSWRSSHLFGLRPPVTTDPKAVQAALARHHVSVSVRGRSVRVSPNVYNDAGDIEALVAALGESVA